MQAVAALLGANVRHGARLSIATAVERTPLSYAVELTLLPLCHIFARTGIEGVTAGNATRKPRHDKECAPWSNE